MTRYSPGLAVWLYVVWEFKMDAAANIDKTPHTIVTVQTICWPLAVSTLERARGRSKSEAQTSVIL